MSRTKKEVGNRGEDLAVQYLEAKGYQILARNWRVRGGELDIVALSKDILVFCEVKCSRYSGDSHPELRVDLRKQTKLAKLAQAYITSTPMQFDSVRFDIIAVRVVQGRESIEHITNAFWPPEGWED